MEFREVLGKRRMHRAFLPDPLPIEQIERVVNVIRRAPSGGFSQGGSIVVVTDDEQRHAIARAFGDEHYSSGGRNYIADAPVLLVISANEALYHARYNEADKLAATGGTEVTWPVPYWFVDAGALMMLVLLAAQGAAAGAGRPRALAGMVTAGDRLTSQEATAIVSRADTCESLEAQMPAVDHERTIRDYFAACTAGDARAIASFFAPDAVHYFPDGDTYPDGSPQRAFRGAEAIGHGFGDRFGGEFRTRWTVDHVIVDAERREAVIEWSNFKPSVSPDARLRGAEFYRFDAAGKIVEIRAYYACPPSGPGRPYELGEFDYAGRGYPVADQ